MDQAAWTARSTTWNDWYISAGVR